MSGLFPATQWTRVIQAREETGPISEQALGELLKVYWRPIYVYLRARGTREEDAGDSVQGFFEHLLDRDFLHRLDPGKGRFRSFLLTALNNWMRDRHQASIAAKRGGGQPVLSLEGMAEESGIEPRMKGLTPEVAFDCEWALRTFRAALRRLRAECARRDRPELYGALVDSMRDPARYTPAALGERLGMSPGAAKKAMFDQRRRLATMVREEVLAVIGPDDDIDAELRYLVDLMREHGIGGMLA